jgi:hypothetical protein
MFGIIAQIGGYSFAQLAIAIIIILAIGGVVVVVAKHSGVRIPQWVWTIAGIVLLAAVGIVAIRFLMSL